MQMQLSGTAQISPPFEIHCCFFSSLRFPLFFFSRGFERKGFVILGRQLESGGEGEAGGWGGQLTAPGFLFVPFLSSLLGEGGEKMRSAQVTPHPFSLQTALQGLARRGQSGVGNRAPWLGSLSNPGLGAVGAAASGMAWLVAHRPAPSPGLDTPSPAPQA